MIERIKALMSERSVNGRQLAMEIGLNHGIVSDWEKGKAKPSTDAIIKIANYFSVSTDYLLTGKEIQQTTNEKENTPMNEKARDSLKQLEKLVKYFFKTDTYQREAKNLQAVGVTPEVLSMWNEYDFTTDTPKTEQLQKMLEIYKSRDTSKNMAVDFSRAINDYIYYMNQEPQAPGKPDAKTKLS